MSDVNFLPKEFQKKEKRERKRHPGGVAASKFSVPKDNKEDQKGRTLADTLHDTVQELENKIRDVRQNKDSRSKDFQEKQPKTIERKEIKPQRAADKYLSENRNTRKPEEKISGKEKKTWLSQVFKGDKNVKEERDSAKEGKILEERVVARKPKREPIRTGAEHDKSINKKSDEVSESSITEENKSYNADIDVNLLPEGDLLQTNFKNRAVKLGIIFILAILVVSILWLGLAWRTRVVINEQNRLEKEIEKISEEIASIQSAIEVDKDTITRIAAVSTILENRHLWSRVLAKIESQTLKSVYLSSISFGDKTLGTEVIAPTWIEAARQLALWQSNISWWEDVTVGSVQQRKVVEQSAEKLDEKEISQEESVVTFDLDAKIKPEAWQ